MGAIAGLWQSTIGKKVVMALSGLVLVGFLITHVLGNLLVFAGPEAINGYAAVLKSRPPLLWGARAILLLATILHVVAALQLARRSGDARRVPYARWEPQISTIAGRTMKSGGLLLLLFIVLHLAHFTLGWLHPAGFTPADVYGNMAVSFRVWWIVALYVIAMVLLGLHLYHGTWSVFQTLGVSHPAYNASRRRLATVVAIAIYGGFTVIPLGLLLLRR